MAAGAASAQPDPLDNVHGPCGAPNVPPGITTVQPSMPMLPPDVNYNCNDMATKINHILPGFQLKDEPLAKALVTSMFDMGVAVESLKIGSNMQNKLFQDIYANLLALPQSLKGKGTGQSTLLLRTELDTLKQELDYSGHKLQVCSSTLITSSRRCSRQTPLSTTSSRR